MWSTIFGEGSNVICTEYDYSGAERNENRDELNGAVHRMICNKLHIMRCKYS